MSTDIEEQMIEVEIEHATAQAMASAIATVARGEPDAALRVAAETVMYLGKITNTDIPDFLMSLKYVEETFTFNNIEVSTAKPLPEQNAPTSDTTQ